jgi:hypothetical protein
MALILRRPQGVSKDPGQLENERSLVRRDALRAPQDEASFFRRS